MRTVKSSFFLFSILGVLISSCNTNIPAITELVSTSIPNTETPTATVTLLPDPTFTPTIIPTQTSLPSNEPGLIASLGESVSGPSYPGLAVFSPDGQIIAHVNPRIRFWDVNTHELIREIEFPFEQGCTFAESKFSPNGIFFAVSITNCWRSEDPAGKLLIWDSSTGQLLQEWTQEYAKMPGPTGKAETDYSIPVYAFAFLPNNTSVVFASGNTLETRDIVDNQVYDVLNLGAKMYATEISLSSDARLAYVVMSWTKDHDWPILWTYQHKFQIWNINTHAFLYESKYPEGWVNLSLKLLGTQLVQVDIEKATSQIRNLETEEVHDIPYRRGWRYYNSDGSLVIYARLFGFDDEEQAIELWRTDNWRNIYTFTPDFGKDWIYVMHDIVFSPDNTILAIEHNEQISLWNIGPVLQP